MIKHLKNMEYFNILKGELKKGISMVKDNLTKTDLEKKLKKPHQMNIVMLIFPY